MIFDRPNDKKASSDLLVSNSGVLLATGKQKDISSILYFHIAHNTFRVEVKNRLKSVIKINDI